MSGSLSAIGVSVNTSGPALFVFTVIIVISCTHLTERHLKNTWKGSEIDLDVLVFVIGYCLRDFKFMDSMIAQYYCGLHVINNVLFINYLGLYQIQIIESSVVERQFRKKLIE